MSNGKERSALFKFLYTFLRIITFPIFGVLYILKHPLWVAFLALVVFGLVVYYPLNQGVELKDVVTWYQHKYAEVKLDAAKKAAGSGHNIVSEESLQVLQDEVDANNGAKGENYNNRLSRDKELEEKTSALKKRGGFKRKNAPQTEEDENTLGLENVTAGGLEAILSEHSESLKKEEAPLTEEKVQTPAEDAEVQLQAVPELPKPQKEEKPAENDDLDEFDLF